MSTVPFLILVAVHYTTRTYRFLIPQFPNSGGCSLYHPHPPVPISILVAVVIPPASAVPISNSGGCSLYPPAHPQYRFLILVAVHYTTRTSAVPISNSVGLFIIPPARPQYRFLILVAVHYTTAHRTDFHSTDFLILNGCSLYHPIRSTDPGGLAVHYTTPPARPQYRFLILVAVHYTTTTSTVPISNSGGCSLYHPHYRFLILVAVHCAHPVHVHSTDSLNSGLFVYTTRTSTVPISSEWLFIPHVHSTVLQFWWLFIIPPARPHTRTSAGTFLILVAVHYTTRTSTVPISNSGGCSLYHPHVRSTDFLILVAVHYTTRTSAVPISNSGGCSLYHPHVRSTDFSLILSGCSLYHPHVRSTDSNSWWLFVIPPRTSTVPIFNSGGCSLYHRTSAAVHYTTRIRSTDFNLVAVHLPPARPQYRFLILVAVHYTRRIHSTDFPEFWWLFIYTTRTSTVPISNSGGCSLYQPHPRGCSLYHRIRGTDFYSGWLFIYTTRTSTVPISNSGGCSLCHRILLPFLILVAVHLPPAHPRYRFLILVAVHYAHPHIHRCRFLILVAVHYTHIRSTDF
ncbi:unnamed protein product [Acanthosepion pharaonis]|uniref:Uncharacterized protein n=1 Tax=Acanthosepion pharaonis TaxID=158019 RepID=A0A812EQE4_ACAPH|nr:unnamed protein product [Sepia pharaonis]